VIGRLPPAPLLLLKGRYEPRPGAYGAIPWSWGRELRLLSAEARADAPHVTAPALVLHGGEDDTAHTDGARWLARTLRGDPVELRVFPRSGHVLPLSHDAAEVCQAVVSFFRRT
jgi:pimeloyl-ACP methyl ester carboxylesterase